MEHSESIANLATALSAFQAGTAEIFEALAAPLDPQSVKTLEKRDKKSGHTTSIRYIDARTVIERLNSICPGQWTFETELLSVPQAAGDKWVFKGRLTVCGAWQEDVGMNDNEDYYDPPKAAVSDALKRCAVHFGIGTELYGDVSTKRQAPTTAKPVQAVKAAPVEAHKRPYTPEALRENTGKYLASKEYKPGTEEQAKKLAIMWKNILHHDDNDRHLVASYILATDLVSFNELSGAEIEALSMWLKNNPAAAREEAAAILAAYSQPEVA
jgi:hypothetical protein